jgi:alkylation response protein AidB-like acyl-CoA dehydrogenase
MADGLWISNHASESVKASNANVVIQTEATKTDGGWIVNGTKSFGCLTGSADYYLVTARRADVDGLDGLSLFLVPREAEGVSGRGFWDGLGMRASGNDGIVLKDVFIKDDEALTLEAGFTRATKVARGSWVGNQVAIAAIYGGIARGAYEFALERVMTSTFVDTGAPLASSPMHQVLIGNTEMLAEEAHLWLRRQLQLETADPEILPNAEVARNWRLAKGAACERTLAVCANAIKMCGTSGALMNNVLGRQYRDASMGLVQAFPAERGRLDVAKQIVEGQGWSGLTTLPKG